MAAPTLEARAHSGPSYTTLLDFTGACDKLFEETASGARGSTRPKLDEAMTYLREGDTLRVSSIDRLARSTLDLERIVTELNERGVTVEFVERQLRFAADEHDPMNDLLRRVLSAVAEFEREMIRSRQREGIEQAKREGVYKGRKPALNAEKVAQVRRRAATGEGHSQLAKDYGVSRRVIYDVANYSGAYEAADEDLMTGSEPLPLDHVNDG